MEEELKEFINQLINDIKIKMNEDPVAFVIYPEIVNLLDEYYKAAFIDINLLKMKHLLESIRDRSSKLSSRVEINTRIKSLIAKLNKFHKIIFDFNAIMKIEANYYKKEVISYLKFDFRIKKLLIHSLYQARNFTTLTVRLADKTENDWKQIYDQLQEKSNLLDRIINIYERGKYIDLETALTPIFDSFIVIQITSQSLSNNIELLKNVKNLTKLDKFELNTSINKLEKFKSSIQTAKNYHNLIINEVKDFKHIHSKYNSN